MNKRELDRFRKLLEVRRAQLSGEFGRLATDALQNRQSASGDLSAMPIHMADIASDNFEKELNLDFMQMESAELRDITEALSRIDQGTFGTCESCGGDIPKSRLEAMPSARLCIECKREEEGQG
jgi:RNA polymerase-binding protein DksA